MGWPLNFRCLKPCATSAEAAHIPSSFADADQSTECTTGSLSAGNLGLMLLYYQLTTE
ncbi:hypothetical protein GOODEAATRI_032010, partial [Goodea atripinnis]